MSIVPGQSGVWSTGSHQDKHALALLAVKIGCQSGRLEDEAGSVQRDVDRAVPKPSMNGLGVGADSEAGY